jgi:hypothetical protein
MNKTAMTLVTTVLLLVLGALAAGEDYEKANREGAFILAHNRYSVVSIGVDTTNPDLLKLAIDLQATIFNLGGARPPIENIGPRVPPGSTNLMWRMIYFVQDLRSMGEQPLYTVAWEHLQPGYSMNCPKRLRITYRDVESAREAIEAILKKEFGIGLIDTWDYQWAYSLFYNNAFSIVPKKVLVSNLGFNENATHITNDYRFGNRPSQEMEQIIHPEKIEYDEVRAKKIFKDRFGIEPRTPIFLLKREFQRTIKKLVKS